jgi:hypothetical protein
MGIEHSERPISVSRHRRDTLRDRLGTASTIDPTLEASVQLLQGLACERSEAAPVLMDPPRRRA